MVIFSGLWFINYSSMMSFFRIANKQAIYQLGIISLAHAQVRVTDLPVVNVPVDELSSAQFGSINCVRH
jgi:hypothetical protein